MILKSKRREDVNLDLDLKHKDNTMKKLLSAITFFAIGFVAGGVNGQTYTTEVADIINNNCVVCHREAV